MAQKSVRTPEVEELLSALVSLTHNEEAFRLLEDLCTPREILEIAQRLTVAGMLSGGAHYATIQEKTGASATTIARVSKALNYGSGGYQRALEMLAEDRAAAEEGARS